MCWAHSPCSPLLRGPSPFSRLFIRKNTNQIAVCVGTAPKQCLCWLGILWVTGPDPGWGDFAGKAEVSKMLPSLCRRSLAGHEWVWGRLLDTT